MNGVAGRVLKCYSLSLYPQHCFTDEGKGEKRKNKARVCFEAPNPYLTLALCHFGLCFFCSLFLGVLSVCCVSGVAGRVLKCSSLSVYPQHCNMDEGKGENKKNKGNVCFEASCPYLTLVVCHLLRCVVFLLFLGVACVLLACSCLLLPSSFLFHSVSFILFFSSSSSSFLSFRIFFLSSSSVISFSFLLSFFQYNER